MQGINKKPIIIVGVMAAIILVGYIIYISITNITSDVDVSEDRVAIETTTLKKDTIKDAVMSTLGQKGYPNRYSYDRPVDISEFEHYDNGWVTARVEILDEPPQSGYRYLIYILQETDEEYEPVASSQFETEGINIPSNIPKSVMEDFLGSHD